ncbi:MAG: macro domain-containing protein [Gemmataceae bacterium]
MQIQIVLVDINSKMVGAWEDTFEDNPEVQIVEGSMLNQQVDAWVTPTNSRGSMDGGLDAVIKNHFGNVIQTRVQQEIAKQFGGLMPVGHATCVPTGVASPKYLISVPTMISSSEDISDTMNVALACAAAFQMVHMQNEREEGSIRSVALPGLGAATGQVPVEICADLMWTGYNTFLNTRFKSFAAMREQIEDQLDDLNPTPRHIKLVHEPKPMSDPSQKATPNSEKTEDFDFDDFE